MKTLGFVLFIAGACGMDSESLIIPTLLIAAGLALVFVGRREHGNHI